MNTTSAERRRRAIKYTTSQLQPFNGSGQTAAGSFEFTDVSFHMAFAYPTKNIMATDIIARNVLKAEFCFRDIFVTVDYKVKSAEVWPFDDETNDDLSKDLEWMKYVQLLSQVLNVAKLASLQFCPSKHTAINTRIVPFSTSLMRTVASEAYGLPANDDLAWRQMFKNSLMYAVYIQIQMLSQSLLQIYIQMLSLKRRNIRRSR
jgi:hypothetical protein